MPSDKELNGEQKSAAYLIYSELGPLLRLPRGERLASEFPQLTASQIDEILIEFKKVDQSIWKLAKEGGPRNISKEEFAASLSQTYPFLNEAAQNRAWSRGGYYTAQEGFLPKKP